MHYFHLFLFTALIWLLEILTVYIYMRDSHFYGPHYATIGQLV